MDLRDYYDEHWTHVPEGQVDYSRLQYVVDALEPGERVLDSGCGPGFLAELLARHGVDVETYKRRNLLRTTITSEEVARAVVALCDDTFPATTGAQIPVDGGNERVV